MRVMCTSVLTHSISCSCKRVCPDADVLKDTFRLNYYQQYLAEATKAVEEDGVLLKGYFAWSLLDNFEWADGYAKRFGIVHVDYNSMQRRPKQSAYWLRDFFAYSQQPSPAVVQQ